MNSFIDKDEDFTKKILENLNYITDKNQYTIFQVSDKFFSISVNFIQEFTEYKKITSLPDSFKFIEGMINYRGITIPVINLKKRIKEQSIPQYNKHSIVIIVNNNNNLFGILTDNIIDIVPFEENKINKNIEMLSAIEKKIIKAVYNYKDNIIMILELENMLI